MTRSMLAAFAALLFLSLAAPPARADMNGDIQTCQGKPSTGVSWQERIDACSRLIDTGQLDNKNLETTYYLRGFAYGELDEYRSAVSDFSQAIRLDPSDIDAWYNRGVNYFALNDYNSALIDYTKTVQLNPSDEYAWYNLGKTHSALGDKNSAIDDYDHALKLNPNDADALNNRASVLRELHRYAEAIAGYRAALKVDPDHALAYYGLSQIERAQGNIEQADKDLARYKAILEARKKNQE